MERTNSGLLAVYIAGDANHGFSAADFEGGASAGTLQVNGSTGVLEAEHSGVGYWRHQGTGASSRSKRMVQAVIETPTGPGDPGDYPTVSAHMETGASHDDAASAGLTTVDDGFNAGFFVEERDDDSSIQSSLGSLPYKSNDTPYRVSLFVDGASLVGYDFLNDEVLTLTLSNLSSGHAGFTGCCSGEWTGVREWWDFEDREISCSGLPTGHKLQLRDEMGAVLAEATESGGVATIPLMDIALSEIEDVVVVDASNTIVDGPFAPDGVTDPFIVGGDTFKAELPLSASTQVVSTTTGALSVLAAIAATATTLATATAALVARVALTAASAASSKVTARTSVGVATVGSAAALSATGGGLAAGVSLTGTASATSTASGVLTVSGAPDLVGSVATVSTAVGSLSVRAPLGAAAAASSQASGVLSTQAAIAAASEGLSVVTGALASRFAAASTAGAVSSFTGLLSPRVALAALGAATSSTSGALTVAGILEIAPPHRTFQVPPEPRVLVVVAERRTHAGPEASRTVRVRQERRVAGIRAENRTLTIIGG